jgi:Protein of unknown function (DUF3352)
MRRVNRSLALVAVAAIPFAGCGGAASEPGVRGPASLVPESAPLYVEAVVQPKGELRDDTEAALKKLLRTGSPGREIRALLDSIDEGFTFDRDVKPWLGERAGIFITSFTDDLSGAIVVATTDTAKARAALHKDIRAPIDGETPKVRTRRYHGVTYEVDDDGDAEGIVRGFAVIGDEAGLQRVVDTRPGTSLARSQDYRRARPTTGQHLVTAYVQLDRLVAVLSKDSILSPDDAKLLREALGSANARAFGLGLALEAGKLALDSELVATKRSESESAGGKDVSGLPADAWLAVSMGRLGSGIADELDQLDTLAGVDAEEVEDVLRTLRDDLGLDVRRDLLSWMGDASLFVRGTSVSTLGGALVVHSTDTRRSRAAVGKLGRVLRRLGGFSVHPTDQDGVDAGIAVESSEIPFRLHFAAAGDRFVIAVGDAALRDVLHPAATLGDAPQFRNARKALDNVGGPPELFLDTQKLLSLVGDLGLDDDRDYRQVRPYLDVLGPVIASGGTEHERDGAVTQTSRIAVVLR